MVDLAVRYSGGDTLAGPTISLAHFGANFLFNREGFDEGVGDGGFDETASALGVRHVRYPGGTMTERQFDPANPDNTYQSTDLTTGAPIANADQHDLTPLSGLLAYAGAAGAQVSVVLPTARYLGAILAGGPAAAAVEAEIGDFVRNALAGPNGDTIEVFEIGNEWYFLGLSPAQYGLIADRMATWIAEAIADTHAETPGAGDPMIALQIGNRAGRLDETQAILAQLSDPARAAVDAVILHNYRPYPWDQAATTSGKFVHVGLAEAAIGRPLHTIVSEWNVANGSAADGLLQAAGMLDMFDQMVRLGMDWAHVWPVLENNTTRLAGDIETPGEPADMMIGGEIFRQMVQTLPGTRAATIDSRIDIDGIGGPDFLLHAYRVDGGDGAVAFVSSLRGEAREVVLDLSALDVAGAGHLWLTRLGVAAGVDPTSSSARPEVSAVALDAFRPGLGEMPLALSMNAFETVRLEFDGSDLRVGALADGPGLDIWHLTAAPEVLVLGGDDAWDIATGFDLSFDRIDVSALGILGFGEMVVRVDGDPADPDWVAVSRLSGDGELYLRFGGGADLDPARLTARHFIFADPAASAVTPVVRQDGPGLDIWHLTALAEVLVLGGDGTWDIATGFDLALDRIDVSALGFTGLDHMVIRADGDPADPDWVAVTGTSGSGELYLRFGAGVDLDPAHLTARHFIFADPPASPLPPAIRIDGPGLDIFYMGPEAEVLVLGGDASFDIAIGFDPAHDVIDVSALGIARFEDLVVRTDGPGAATDWIAVTDLAGNGELYLRYADGAALDPANLGAESFVFGG